MYQQTSCTSVILIHPCGRMQTIYLSRKNIEVHMYGRIFFSGKLLLEFYHLFLPHLQQIMAKPSISFGMSVHVSSQDTLIYVVLFSCASFLLGDFCDILACVWCNQMTLLLLSRTSRARWNVESSLLSRYLPVRP